VGQELLYILQQFGGGGEDGNTAARFLLASFFWGGLAYAALMQYRRLSERRDFFILLAALVGLSRELLTLALDYGSMRGFVDTAQAQRFFPPLAHALTDIGRVLLGFAWIRFCIPGERNGRVLLGGGVAVFVLLYLATAPGWAAFYDARVASPEPFKLFWGDTAFRTAASVFLALVIARLLLAKDRERPVPPLLVAGLSFLFLDEFLMLLHITAGLDRDDVYLGLLRHNLSVWAIPLFLATYWEELVRRVMGDEEKLRTTLAEREKALEERAAAEAARLESEERYRTLVENIDLGITLIDEDFRIVMVNRKQASLFGKDPSWFAGKECFREFQRKGAPCPGCHGVEAMVSGKAVVRENEGVREDGSTFSVRIQAYPVLAADGSPRGFIEVVEDVTEQKRSVEERRRLEERMQQSQKLESLGVLAGGIAHDFNNLLVSMLGNVDMALNKVANESPVRPFLQRIEGAVQRAADLTNQMLAYSGKGRFVVEPIDMTRVVEEMVHLLKTVVSKRALLNLQLAKGLPLVEGDATQLRQVVMNLITNASDAIGDADGVVTVRTGVTEVDDTYPGGSVLDEAIGEGRYVYVEVTDTGCGMDAATRDRIFDPFFTTKHTGRGLGLAAVLGIVRGHRGGLRVYSERGRGTTFKVLLPALSASAPSLPGPGEEEVPEEVPAGGGTVLVADDEEAVREVASMMLESGGYEVVPAVDGQEAVEIFRREPGRFAAVILDMTMPRMGGEEAFREIRRTAPGIPVILSSGYNEQESVNRFVGKGLSGFIQKPYRSKDLIAKVREAVAAGS
jgi:PAS domain S-box-containing protein